MTFYTFGAASTNPHLVYDVGIVLGPKLEGHIEPLIQACEQASLSGLSCFIVGNGRDPITINQLLAAPIQQISKDITCLHLMFHGEEINNQHVCYLGEQDNAEELFSYLKVLNKVDQSQGKLIENLGPLATSTRNFLLLIKHIWGDSFINIWSCEAGIAQNQIPRHMRVVLHSSSKHLTLIANNLAAVENDLRIRSQLKAKKQTGSIAHFTASIMQAVKSPETMVVSVNRDFFPTTTVNSSRRKLGLNIDHYLTLNLYDFITSLQGSNKNIICQFDKDSKTHTIILFPSGLPEDYLKITIQSLGSDIIVAVDMFFEEHLLSHKIKEVVDKHDFLYQALLISTLRNDLEQVRYLISIGAQINHTTLNKLTPLFLACEFGYIEIVEDLLARGAIVNCQYMNSTPLLKACEHGHYHIAKRLLQAGANIHSKFKYNDGKEYDAFELALSWNHLNICFLILSSVSVAQAKAIIYRSSLAESEKLKLLQNYELHNIQSLITAIKEEDIKQIQSLISKGINVNQTSSGLTPLHIAISKGNFAIVKILLNSGANIYEKRLSLDAFDLAYTLARSSSNIKMRKEYEAICNLLLITVTKEEARSMMYREIVTQTPEIKEMALEEIDTQRLSQSNSRKRLSPSDNSSEETLLPSPKQRRQSIVIG